MEKGKLIGVGVGPGDPELLTIKALRRIEESQVIAVPGETYKDSVAYQIAAAACKSITEKEIVAISMPMTKDTSILKESHDRGAETLQGYLEEGKQVAFLTLGDPTVYSTYLYLHKRLQAEGYEVEIIPGITSFCAAAAKLNIGLSEGAEALHIIPASYPLEDALHLSGTKILMKSGKKLGEVKEKLMKHNAKAVMVENCGMPKEKTYTSLEEIPEKGSYYSLLIVKENL